MTIEDIAKVCHEANRAYCSSIGDTSQAPWELAPDWQKESAVKGVQHRIENPDSQPRDSHESWLKEKANDGWIWGKEKSPIKKTHPCCVSFEELPKNQQQKDVLFISVCDALLPLL